MGMRINWTVLWYGAPCTGRHWLKFQRFLLPPLLGCWHPRAQHPSRRPAIFILVATRTWNLPLTIPDCLFLTYLKNLLDCIYSTIKSTLIPVNSLPYRASLYAEVLDQCISDTSACCHVHMTQSRMTTHSIWTTHHPLWYIKSDAVSTYSGQKWLYSLCKKMERHILTIYRPSGYGSILVSKIFLVLAFCVSVCYTTYTLIIYWGKVLQQRFFKTYEHSNHLCKCIIRCEYFTLL